MGWNQLRIQKPAPPLAGAAGRRGGVLRPLVLRGAEGRAADRDGDGLSRRRSRRPIWQDNVFATQFHPEKSQKVGLEMLRRFAEWK